MISTISRSETDFFLTGGTALSRGYYNHRYSDDLDFFVNKSQTFDEQLDAIRALLMEDGFIWDEAKEYIRAAHFSTMKVRDKNSDTLLKLDFVNDLVPHFGGITETAIFCRTDSIRNIISNKLSAIFRFAAKDVADIREIALHESIVWPDIIAEARQKEAGIEPTYICQILEGMPKTEFDTIAWTQKTDWQTFQDDITRIVQEIMHG